MAFFRTFVFAWFLGHLFWLGSYAQLPPDAQKLLDSLPNKSISLDLVLQKALQSSDSIRAAVAEVPSLQAAELKVRAALDPEFFVKAMWMDDQNKPSNSFQPQSVLTTNYSLGASKLFTTGTRLAAEIGHSYTELGFATLTIPPFYETTGKITLTQSLWNNAFGYGTRRLQEAAKLSTRVKQLTFDSTLEEWTLGLVQLYYKAWLAKAQADLGEENLVRRQKLLRITQIKNRRGTAEEQDLLQIQSASLNAEVQKDRSNEALNSVWRELVIALKLPRHWIDLDPKLIPMTLDSPTEPSLILCREKKAAPKTNAGLEATKVSAEAAKLNLERTRNALAPDLNLSLQLNGNGLNQQRGPSFDEALRVDNPAWSVGLELKVPLHRYGEEAEYRTAITNHIRAEANYSLQQGQLELNWVNACRDLLRLETAYKKIQSAFSKQSRRANLEERLFSIGRSPTINVIQAEDDATNAKSLMNQTEAEMRAAAWRVRRLKGLIPSYLSKLGFDTTKMTAELFKKSNEKAN